MRYKPPSIRQKGLAMHFKEIDKDYPLFCLMVERGMNPTNIAKWFKVDRRTAMAWTKIFHEELAKKQKT